MPVRATILKGSLGYVFYLWSDLLQQWQEDVERCRDDAERIRSARPRALDKQVTHSGGLQRAPPTLAIHRPCPFSDMFSVSLEGC